MIIVATRASPASRAGSFFSTFLENRRTLHIASQRSTKTQGGLCMPRGRSTFTKRQKEQARQQKQRDKAERRNQRKQEKTEGSVDEMRELREHACTGEMEGQPPTTNGGSNDCRKFWMSL